MEPSLLKVLCAFVRCNMQTMLFEIVGNLNSFGDIRAEPKGSGKCHKMLSESHPSLRCYTLQYFYGEDPTSKKHCS